MRAVDPGTLVGRCVLSIFAETSDERKLDVVAELCGTVDTHTFFEHHLVKDMARGRLCSMLPKCAPPEEVENLKWLFMRLDTSFQHLSWLFNDDALKDCCRHVRPSKWTKCVWNANRTVTVLNEVAPDYAEPFDFQRDVVQTKLDPDRLRKINGYKWYEF